MKRYMIFVLVFMLLVTGCGESDADTYEEVSAQWRGFTEDYGLTKDKWKESGVVFEDRVMEFKDPVIEEMLRNMLGKLEGDVYISDLQNIHAIYWTDNDFESIGYYSNLQSENGDIPRRADTEAPWETKQPESLEDLAYCYNLQHMSFGRIDIPSLKPLYDLPLLEELSFCYALNTEEKLQEVSELSGLKSITFSLGKLTSLESLCKLPQLECLEFQGVIVTEKVLEDIGKMPALKSLIIGNGEFVSWGHLTDGSFLLPIAGQLTELWAQGAIDWNPEVLAQMTEMEMLLIDYADDVSFLEQMPKLKRLNMYCCCPSDWSPLGTLENLEYLKIGGNSRMKVDIELEDLAPLTNLDYLCVSFTSINDEHSRKEILETLPSLTGLVTQLF